MKKLIYMTYLKSQQKHLSNFPEKFTLHHLFKIAAKTLVKFFYEKHSAPDNDTDMHIQNKIDHVLPHGSCQSQQHGDLVFWL